MLHRPLTSPKRNGARQEADLYYYYAAFAPAFAEQKVLELDLPRGSLILDPWCGSGTALAAARRFGHHSIGCDINPVSVVLTKSRFASASDVNAVLEVFRKAIDSLADASSAERRPDVLIWSLRNRLFGFGGDCSWSVDDYRSLTPRTALLLTALFFFARHATRATRSKNPSWRKQQTRARLSLSEFKACYENLKMALIAFRDSASCALGHDTTEQILLINNERIAISSGPVADAVITSPPYLTRLDYGVSTGLEWRLLNGNPKADLTDWRASFTGSVLTSHVVSSTFPLPRSVGDILSGIHRHQSKAARTYYFQFFRNYFAGIQNAVGNISDACKAGARGLFVVQDSQFKDLNIPLTALFSDILEARGWSIERIEPFSISPTFYKINSRRWAAGDYVRTENVIWARRGA